MESDPTDPITYASPSEEAHASLIAMARRCFSETFSHLYEPELFNEFLDRTYGADGSMEGDLRNPAVEWMAAFRGSGPVGYAKLTPLRAPAPAPRPNSLELQQIYVLSDWHGRGVADHLMRWALTRAACKQAQEVYLTVFDHNQRAKAFYRRHRFAEVGRCTFRIGNQIDDDRVWRRLL